MNAHGHHHYLNKPKPAKTIQLFVWLAIIGGPIMTLPQIYAIWVSKNTGVSVATWVAYVFVNAVWFVYGVIHKEKPLAIAQAVWVVLDTLIVAGLLINR